MKKFQSLMAALLIAVSSVMVFGFAQTSAADTSGSGNGMKVSPVRTDFVLQPGESKVVSVYLQNVTKAKATYKVITNDFVSRDETGSASLLLNGEVNTKHGLKQYFTVPKTITVEAGEQAEVKVTVSIPKDAAGGGYYGAIRFAPANSSDGNENVSLSGSVASLILVSVPGDVTENLQIASFDARHSDNASTLFTSNKDITATVRFRNNGNVQEQPFGKVILKKGDKTLGQYEINNTDPRGNVLPDSIRKFDVKLKNVGSFGKYTIEGNFGYGAKGQLVSAKSTFYVVPLAAIISAIAVLVLIVLAIFVLPRFIRNHDKRVLRQAGRR